MQCRRGTEVCLLVKHWARGRVQGAAVRCGAGGPREWVEERRGVEEAAPEVWAARKSSGGKGL